MPRRHSYHGRPATPVEMQPPAHKKGFFNKMKDKAKQSMEEYNEKKKQQLLLVQYRYLGISIQMLNIRSSNSKCMVNLVMVPQRRLFLHMGDRNMLLRNTPIHNMDLEAVEWGDVEEWVVEWHSR